MLKLYMNLFTNNEYKLPWLKHVYSTLNNLGLTFLWHRQSISVNSFKKLIKQRMKDQYIQHWNGEMSINSLCYNYKMFKSKFRFEEYLIQLDKRLHA